MLTNMHKVPVRSVDSVKPLGVSSVVDLRKANVRQMKMQQLADLSSGSDLYEQDTGDVVQRVPMRMDVNGLTHLVRMENGGLYNPDFTQNEVMEVTADDSVVIDTDRVHFSKRGPNQEVNAHTDGQQGPQYYWYQVISVNRASVGTDVFIRRDALLEADDDRDNSVYELPYNFLMSNFGKIAPSNPNDRAVLAQLLALKRQYDSIPSTTQNAEVKLRIADDIGTEATHLQSPELQQIAETLHRFPHVVLDHGQRIPLSHMVDIMNQIDNTRELGLLNMQHANGSGRLGLMMGPKKSEISGAGASVTAPGRTRPGFGNARLDFIAHTHPRALHTQQAHTGELAKDVQGAHGMEMVRAHSGETMFYDQQGPKNNKDAGRFIDGIKKPTFVFSRIARFTILSGDYEYSGTVPSEADKAAAIAAAQHEADVLWNQVQEAEHILRNGNLRREEYVHYLHVLEVNMDILENGPLQAIQLYDQQFPTKAKPREDDEYSLF